MNDNNFINTAFTSPLQEINDALFTTHHIKVFIKRDDKIHPDISGNKWRKLKHNLIFAQQQNKQLLISFGGAYSNHIHALAHAGKIFNFKTLGIIRGEYDRNNPTLKQAIEAGMELKFISRSEYKQRNNPLFIAELNRQYPHAIIIPEGGTNDAALLGVQEMLEEVPIDKADYIICPCGSGGTTAGLLQQLQPHQRVISIAVLKQANYLKKEILTLSQGVEEQLEFIEDYHYGGYGKVTPELLTFIQHFKQLHQIQLEPIYSGKMMMGFYNLVAQGYFKPGSAITLIHTGGLQGLNGLKQRKIIPQDF